MERLRKVAINLVPDTKKYFEESIAMSDAVSLEEAFKRILFERIEDEYDITVCEEAHDVYVKTGKKNRPVSEL